MTSKNEALLSDKYKRIVIILLAFLLFNLVSFLLDPYDPYWKYYKEELGEKIFDLFLELIFCIIISESSIRVSNKLNKSITWTERPRKRLFLEIGINLVVISICLLIQNYIYFFFFEIKYPGQAPMVISFEETRGFIQWIVVSVIIAFVIIGVNIVDFLIVNWKNTLLKASELDRAVTEAELQALKLQIDPHFVFNNLSVLSELILQNQKVGYDYAENFSKIYRYMLINSRKDFIALKEELSFLQSYIFLIKQRIGEGVLFDITIDASYQTLYILPLTLQLLVENALKHNKTQKSNPLKIKIYINPKKELVVENTLLPIENTIDSSGIGLSNIIRRYSLLTNHRPIITRESAFFSVEVPLISMTNDK
ncbi:MAG TPA: sensor histidine kinase [Bacteroidales bacterium]|nr:sensor histidine kinase [Bacteroidales bacterium]